MQLFVVEGAFYRYLLDSDKAVVLHRFSRNTAYAVAVQDVL